MGKYMKNRTKSPFHKQVPFHHKHSSRNSKPHGPGNYEKFGMNIDKLHLPSFGHKKCPFTGNVSIHGRILSGQIKSKKMERSIVVKRKYFHYLKKYHRYEKRHSNISAHLSHCF